MRFSAAFLATAAIITPSVLAATGKAPYNLAARGIDHGLNVGPRDTSESLMKVRGLDIGNMHRREEPVPGHTDGKNDAIMKPSPNADLSAPESDEQSDSSPPTASQPTSPESSSSGPTPDDDAKMLDPSSMPSPSPSPSGEEAGYSGARGFLRPRSLDARQNDDGEDEESYAETRCDPENDEDCDDERNDREREAFAEQRDNEEPSSDKAKYLAKSKRAREQHMKTARANHTLKQASRREVVERAKLGRRAGSRPSASARPPT